MNPPTDLPQPSPKPKPLAIAAWACIISIAMSNLSCHQNSGLANPSASAAAGTLSNPSVLVEKSARRMTIKDGQTVVKIYRIICGTAAGDKEREGDFKTPEGRFYVCYKNPDSKFTLSLGLSYPNDEDAARGLRDCLITRQQHDEIVSAIAAGQTPPWYTPLGGEIMIHGCANERAGTAGCIAVTDDEIREIYPMLKEGTPVTIVP